MSPRFKLSQFSAIKGDGLADDTLPFLDACRQMPNGAVCEWDVKMRWTDTVALTIRNRLRFWNAYDPRDITPQEMEYGAFYDGRPGNDMLVLDRCRRFGFEGIALSATPHNEATGGANRCVVLDQRQASGDINSRASFVRCQITSGIRNPDWIGIANAMDATGNCEYPRLDQVKIVGGAGGAGLCRWYGRYPKRNDNGISIEAGSTRAIAAKPGTFRPSDMVTQERVRIASAAGSLNTRIVTVIDDQQAELADPAPVAFVKAYTVIGQSFGTGFLNGPFFDAKRAQLNDVEIYGCQYGVHSLGGSQQLMQLNAGDNEVDVFIEGQQSDPSWEIGTQSENSRAHLWNLSGEPYAIGTGSRFACNGIAPGSTYLDCGSIGGGDIYLTDGVSFDEDPLPPGSTCWGLSKASRFVDWRGVLYPNQWSRQDIGCDVAQLSNAALIHVLGGRALGAGFAAEEWISGQVPNARLRRSGGIGQIFGMAFNHVRGKELKPGEWTVKSVSRGAGNTRRLELLARDWDGQLRTVSLASGKGDSQDEEG